MTVTRWTFAGVILALTALPLGAQEVKVRTIGAGLDESFLRISSADFPHRREDSGRGLVISEKGEILTAWRTDGPDRTEKLSIQSGLRLGLPTGFGGLAAAGGCNSRAG